MRAPSGCIVRLQAGFDSGSRPTWTRYGNARTRAAPVLKLWAPLSSTMPLDTSTRPPKSEFLRSLAQGVVLGAIALAVALPWMRAHPPHRAPDVSVPSAAPEVAASSRPAAPAPLHPHEAHRLADFRGVSVSPDVREVANWSFYTRDNHGHSVVILDKKAATVYAFDPSGRLVSSAPVLLGLTISDDTEPGIGDKPLSQIRDDEKTTPAGRFVAEPGENTQGEDIVWIDYDQALAMHRVIKGTPAEQRARRLASPDPRERRISFGCINLPPAFYDHVLSPAVKKTGAIVYILPEIKTTRQVFGSWDVTEPGAHPPPSAGVRSAATSARGKPARAYRENPAAASGAATAQ
jgi:hypothetical protein